MGKGETVEVSGGEEGTWKLFAENSGKKGVGGRNAEGETGWCGIGIEREMTHVVFVPGPWHRASSKALGISQVVGVMGGGAVIHNNPLSTAPELHAAERTLGGRGLAARGTKHVTRAAPSPTRPEGLETDLTDHRETMTNHSCLHDKALRKTPRKGVRRAPGLGDTRRSWEGGRHVRERAGAAASS